MPAVHPKFGWDGVRPSYEVTEAVKGGQLVMADGAANGKVKVATANAAVLGVAMTDAQPAGTSDTSTDSFGNTVVNAALHPPYIAVGMNGAWMLKNAGAALVQGDLVKAAAAGEVTKQTTAATDIIIGRVVDAGGATGALVCVLLNIVPAGIAS